MNTIQIYGRLGRDPEEKTTASGKSMVTGSMVVSLGRQLEAACDEWFSLIAFGRIGETLSRHAKGDQLAVSGKLTKSVWQGKDGQQRSGFSIMVDCLSSAKTAMFQSDKGRHKQEATTVDDRDDDLPF
ncbi:MAG: single-stranded DNA-binding protein [Gammaproteobacteria bacterium]